MRHKKSLIAAAAFSALALTGCEMADSSMDLSADQESAASKHALEQLNKEKEVAHEILAQMKVKDPTIKDVYFNLDETGQRTMVVVREKPDGSLETWEAPSLFVEQAFKSSEPEQGASSDHSFSSGSSALLVSMLTGYMMANAFSSSTGRMQQMSREEQERERTRARGVYSSGVMQRARSAEAARSSLGGGRASSVGRSWRGSFRSSGDRSGGYSGGG